MWARTRNGEKAAEALRTFATCFCLPNSFHVNGDQSGTGKSKFTYRPFTLEGNFACAAGIQEMLLQSHNGVLRIFPAIPESWQDVSFNTMRAEGALLVSAVRAGGKTRSVKIASEKGGIVKMINPFAGDNFKTKVRGGAKVQTEGRFLRFKLMPADAIEFVLE
jgi:alpha-L-fucosidase 2